MKYFIGFDCSLHRYLVPLEKLKEWQTWCEIPEDDERSWVAPEYAQRIEGGLLTFENPEVVGGV